jgi:hypothetical protein
VRQPGDPSQRGAARLLVAAALFGACRDPRPAAPDAQRGPPAQHTRTAAQAPPARDAGAAHAAPTPSPVAHAPADAGTRAPSRGFLGLDDDALLARICDAPIERMERNRGGSTISFRLRLEGAQKALFKPQQRASVANFRAELAAYRMSRLLGLHRVPPACGRLVSRQLLQHTADASGDAPFSQRVLTELLGREDRVPGAVLFWVPGQLEEVPDAASYPALLDLAQPLAPERAALAAELSTLIVFDLLNDNVDRWSGGNILRQRSATGAPPGAMLFMDNGASFSALNDGLGARPADQARRLQAMGRFSRSLIARLRGLTAASIAAAMADDPLGPCLSDAQIRAVLTRRDLVLARVAEATRAHPEADVLAFP